MHKVKKMKRVLSLCLGLMLAGCLTVTGCSSETQATPEGSSAPAQTEAQSSAASEPEETTAAASSEDTVLETEILIIGGGLAGMNAAITASEGGASVLLLEKMSFLGGAGLISSGAVDSYGSEFEAQAGIEDSAELLKEDILKAGNGYNIEWMVDTFVAHTGETFDWLVELGVPFQDPTPSEEHTADRVFLAVGGGAAIIEKISEAMQQQNVEVLMQTRANTLLQDESGTVIGCLAENNEGETIEVHADTVILATGGYGANADLLTDTLKEAPYYGFAGSTGDGHIMAEAVGAELVHMDFGKLYPAGWQYEEGKATIQTGYDNYAFANTSAICVTSEGVRAFCEGGYNTDFKNAILNDSEGLVYMLLDQASYTAWRETVLTNSMGVMTNEEELDGFIEAQGNASQVIYQADTLEEVAALAGMDPDVLKETVERYNSFVENGVDEDFGRTQLNAQIGDGPYTLVAQYLRFATTLGGVEVSENYEVLDAEDNPIPGLYAAGEIVFGLHGNDTIQGSPIGWALISGRLAAESILATQ